MDSASTEGLSPSALEPPSSIPSPSKQRLPPRFRRTAYKFARGSSSNSELSSDPPEETRGSGSSFLDKILNPNTVRCSKIEEIDDQVINLRSYPVWEETPETSFVAEYSPRRQPSVSASSVTAHSSPCLPPSSPLRKRKWSEDYSTETPRRLSPSMTSPSPCEELYTPSSHDIRMLDEDAMIIGKYEMLDALDLLATAASAAENVVVEHLGVAAIEEIRVQEDSQSDIPTVEASAPSTSLLPTQTTEPTPNENLPSAATPEPTIIFQYAPSVAPSSHSPATSRSPVMESRRLQINSIDESPSVPNGSPVIHDENISATKSDTTIPPPDVSGTRPGPLAERQSAASKSLLALNALTTEFVKDLPFASSQLKKQKKSKTDKTSLNGEGPSKTPSSQDTTSQKKKAKRKFADLPPVTYCKEELIGCMISIFAMGNSTSLTAPILGKKIGSVLPHLIVGSTKGEKKKSEKALVMECKAILNSYPAFGKVERQGEDADGNPLEANYHYEPTQDPDLERAANMGAFARPKRQSTKKHVQYHYAPISMNRFELAAEEDD